MSDLLSVNLSLEPFPELSGREAEHSNWNTLPAYLQDAIDNMLADEAEQEAGETISLQEMLSVGNDG